MSQISYNAENPFSPVRLTPRGEAIVRAIAAEVYDVRHRPGCLPVMPRDYVEMAFMPENIDTPEADLRAVLATIRRAAFLPEAHAPTPAEGSADSHA